MRTAHKRAAASLSLVAALLYAAGVSAQTPAAQQEEFVLEEIVVTAQKRVENLQDVPISITTLSGEKLDNIRAGAADVRFLRARVPSVYAESSFGRAFPRFYIRGLGNTDFDLNSSQPVSLIYDEVVLENPLLKGLPAYDLDRIEILRGPQGTLFGRNTPGGIIKFESRKPSHDFNGYVRGSVGKFTTVDLEGAVGGPIAEDVLAARVAILYQRRDDWIDNGFTGEEDVLGGFDEFNGRLQLLFTPNERFTALINGHLRTLDGTARVFRANVLQQGGGGLIDDFDRGIVFHDGQNEQDIDIFGFIGKLEYAFDRVTVTSVTAFENLEAFSRGDVDGGFGPGVPFGTVPDPSAGPDQIVVFSETADGIPNLDQFTQEVRLSTNNWERFNFQAGFFYFNEDVVVDTFSFATPFGGGQDGFAQQTQDTEAWAVFGTADFDITDQLRLSAGLRYSDDEKTNTAERTQSPLFFLGQPDLPPTTVSVSDDQVSWNASLAYAASDDVNIYARVAKGFRAPSIQARVLFADAFGLAETLEDKGISVGDTETIHSIEGGVKMSLLERRARLNLSAYYFTMDDQQIVAVGGETNTARLLNADQTNGFGFEVDGELAVNEFVRFTAGLSYNDTEIDDPDLAVATCGAPCTVLDPLNADGFALVDGNRLPHAPRWIANFTARFSRPVAQGEVFLFTDWAYRSRVNFFLYESAEFRDDDLFEGGVRAGYSHNGGQFEVAAFGRNINHDTSPVGGIDFSNLTGFVNEPTIWGFEVGANF